MPVIDSTVLIDLFVGEAVFQERALRLWEQDPLWICPALWRYEVGSVLGQYLRKRLIDRDLMLKLLKEAEGLVMETVSEIDVFAIADISISANLTFYDASYVWLARSRKLPIYTRDSKILESCPDVARQMPTVE